MKRSSKKSRNPEKKARKKQAKKVLAAGMMVCLGTLPVWCDDEVLLTLFPMGSKSVGSYADIQYDMGVGGKLTWRKNGNLDFFVEGDYKNLALPNVSSATMINGGVGAGYHLPINDRWGVNFSAQVGGYRASKSDGVLTGLSGGLNISMTYRINSKISVEAGAAANHYMAKPEPLLTDVGATAGLTLNLTKAFGDSTKVKMETKEVLPVFPVLYSWYKNNSFASVGITNEEDAAIENVQVSFYQPQYMSQPNLCATAEKLGKGETFDAELTAFFNERMLDLTEKTNTEASVIIEYTYLGEKKKKTISMVVPVYGRNSMSWDDDRRASVFVSSKDPAALWFSKYISSVVRDNVRMGVSQNIQYAMGIFDTLDQFGINYVIDPSSAYSDNVGSTSIDFLQFPYQTLTYRGGDCDDLSILTCSLFEAVGIKTAFITIPGHIFMAFDSGMTMNEARQSMMNTDNLINHNGEAWVPLEITLTDEGFSRAWRTGAREWNQAYKDGTAAFYAMEDSWKIYEPVSVPGAAANFTMPEKEIVSRLFQHSMDEWVAREISPVVAEYNARLAMHDTVELRNELGILYGKYGLFVEADDQFKRARRKGYLPSLLNTANVYFARKQYTIALEWYRKVLAEDPANELATLGVARCYYELEDYDQCDAAFDIVRNRNPALASEYTYLGAFEQTVGRSYSLADRIALTKWDTGNTSSGIQNPGNSSGYDDGYGTEDSNGFVVVETGTPVDSGVAGEDADSLLTQLADLNGSNGVLRPDAIVREETKKVVLEDPYAAMDDYNNLVEELPGLLAQLKIPGTNLDDPTPVVVSDTRIASVTTSTPDGNIEEASPVQTKTAEPKQTEPKKDLSSLINRSNLEPKQTVATVTPAPAVTQPKVEEKPVTVATTATVTQPTVEQTPVTVATTATVTQPTVVQTPVTVATTPAVTQPTVEQTPVTVATTATVTQPTVVQTPVTVATTATVTQPTVEQTPVTVATTTPVAQPVVEQTPVTVATTTPVAQPVVEQTPVTVATTTPVTQPVVEQTPVTVTPTVTVTQPVVEQTPVTVATTTPVTQPVVEQTPVTVTPTVAVTQPVVEQTPVTVATTTPVTQPVVEQTPVTVTPTVAVTQPVVEQTPVTVTPTVTVTQPVVEQTPVTVTPTVAVTQPVVEQTPVTVTPTVTVTQPVVEQTPVTVATTTPVTQPVVEQTPVTVTPTVTVPQPVVEQTPVTVATTTPVTQPVVEQTPVTVTPTVTVTQPVVEQTPVTVTPTVAVTQPVVEQTPVTVTPTVAVTQPVVEQTPVTVTQPVVEQTPVTVTPTVAVTQPVVEQTPVTVTPTVAVTQPVVEQTPVTVTPTVTVTQPVVEQTPVTVTPTVAVTQPVVEQTPVTVATTTPVTQPVVQQTPVTVATTTPVTQPVVEQTPVTTPKFTTEPVVIRDTQTVLDELGLEEEDVFAALMNEDDDMFADTPIGALIAEDKAKENERAAADTFGPVLKPTEDETIKQGEEIAVVSVVPTVERSAPRYSDSPSSKWVPEEVYSAKIIPGMKTYEEEMSTYSQDKSWLYEDTNSGLLSDDTEEAIAMEKAKEILAQEEKENARLAQENWDKLINDDVNDPSNPLFSYLSKENLEEIQTVSIVDKIKEQELLSPAEKLVNEKKSGLLAKTNEILNKESSAKKPAVKKQEDEEPEEKELIAQVSTVTEEKPVDNSVKTDSNIVETESEKVQDADVKKSNVWPYVAGGAGLLGLFVIFLIVFWKRDDDDDDKKNSLEKQGVNV